MCYWMTYIVEITWIWQPVFNRIAFFSKYICDLFFFLIQVNDYYLLLSFIAHLLMLSNTKHSFKLEGLYSVPRSNYSTRIKGIVQWFSTECLSKHYVCTVCSGHVSLYYSNVFTFTFTCWTLSGCRLTGGVCGFDGVQHLPLEF